MPREGVSSASSAVSLSGSHWRDAVLDPTVARGGTAPPGSGRAPSWSRQGQARSPTKTCVLILAHCVDFIVLVFLGVTAALFRFGDIYLIRPELQGPGGLCKDPSYALPRRDPAIDVPPYAVDTLAVAAPIVLVGLLELTVAVALHRQVLRTGASGKGFFSRRFAKSILVFLIGLCITSVLTDLLRLLISRPRPYFLANDEFNFGFKRYCGEGAKEDHYRCSVLAYSGAVVAIRAERALRRLRLGGVYVLRALSLVLAVQPALLLASQALDSRSNHWQDVVVGLLLGAALGAYAELVLARELEVQLEAVSAVPLTVAGTAIPIHSLPRPRTEPPPLTAAHLASVMEEANGLGLQHRHKTVQKPDDVFY
ncbi:Phospholipid phosphatase-related protein type 2 [Frankliniella fusca]|uniref:Phospholipid phosphatase-related protein type 2 n=1 Tax=Frankliniella fusca TaxID=407009 RepID=A0AAE1HGP6_9NEOP|nr:Phospholipid phosphatase-related protein type 2 [Frankliniella fusca]